MYIIDWFSFLSFFLINYTSSLLANQIIWNVIRGLIQTLPAPFRKAQAIYLKRTQYPRWRICNFLTNNKAFTFATTVLYANKHLSQSATETVRLGLDFLIAGEDAQMTLYTHTISTLPAMVPRKFCWACAFHPDQKCKIVFYVIWIRIM